MNTPNSTQQQKIANELSQAPEPDPDAVQAADENGVPQATNIAANLEQPHHEKQPADVEASAAESERSPIHSVFSSKTKAFIIVMTALASIFSPISTQIYLPALSTLSKEFHVSNAAINFTVTSYMILQGIAPMFFGDLADQVGRRPTYVICLTIYFFANLGLALQRNYAALLVLRALQSTGGSGTIALGQGVVADITTSAERGAYVAWVQLGTQLGPALGPVLGGILAQFLGWTSIFWFLVICSGVFLILYLIFVPETGRNVVGDGSIPPQGWNRSLINVIESRRLEKNGLVRTESRQQKREEGKRLAETRKLRFPNPLNSLRIIIEKDVALLLFALSIALTGFFCLTVPLPSLFARTYGFNDLQIGLCFIPFSVGAMLGSICCGRFLDRNYRRIALKHGFPLDRKRTINMRHFPLYLARLEVIWTPLIVGNITVLVWGWVLRTPHISLAAPLVILFVSGFMLSGTMSMLISLLVDLYPRKAATAMAALNLPRCTMSAAGTAVVDYIIEAWGLGWTYTFLGLVMMASVPMLWWVMKCGPRWREERFVRQERQEKEKEKKRAERERRRQGGHAQEQQVEDEQQQEQDGSSKETGVAEEHARVSEDSNRAAAGDKQQDASSDSGRRGDVSNKETGP